MFPVNNNHMDCGCKLQYSFLRRESLGYVSQSPGKNALTLVKYAAETMKALDRTDLSKFRMTKKPDFKLR